MYRIAHKGQWKTNVFQGSSCQPCRLSPAIKELCMEAVRVVGLEYTGIDIIEGPNGPVILELNGAPAWHGLESTTNRDISEDIIEHVIHMLKTGRPARQPAKLPLKEPARDR
jgi:glutathione synthase/RimK-type ligase-like ATP-grasp enzyme